MLLTDNKTIQGLQYGNGYTMKGNGKIIDTLLRAKYPGERHVPQIVNGKLKLANFIGPGTNLEARLKDYSNNQPINNIDKTALSHDLRYSLATSNADIAKADNMMLDKLRQLKGTENPINLTAVSTAMKAKALFEKKTGLTTFGRINKDAPPLDPVLEKLYKDRLAIQQQQGYGYSNFEDFKKLYKVRQQQGRGITMEDLVEPQNGEGLFTPNIGSMFSLFKF